MMLPALPEFIQVKKIIFCVLPVLDIRHQAAGNALWVEQNAIGVLQNGKLQFFQFAANMLGEARADQQQLVFIADGLCKRWYLYGNLELHNV